MTWIAFARASRAASASAAIARCNLVSNKYSQDIRIHIFEQIFPSYSYSYFRTNIPKIFVFIFSNKYSQDIRINILKPIFPRYSY